MKVAAGTRERHGRGAPTPLPGQHRLGSRGGAELVEFSIVFSRRMEPFGRMRALSPHDVRAVIAGVVLAAIPLVYACEGGSRHAPPSRQLVQWRSLGSWSGRGNAQTGSFPGVTGSMRVQWRTDHDSPGHAGAFRLTIHSAISGRPLLLAVDHRGAGHDISYMNESPRTFYGVVESADLDWFFTVEEAVQFTAPP